MASDPHSYNLYGVCDTPSGSDNISDEKHLSEWASHLSPWGTIGTFPELPHDHFLFGITAYAYVCTWGWGVVIETTHTMGTWRQGAFDCFLSWTELLAIDKGLMA